MPIHHEKTERKTTLQEGDTSKHRTKQREISVERRPIISQEKPTVSRIKTVPKPDLKKAIPKPSTQKPATNSQSKSRSITGGVGNSGVVSSNKKPTSKTPGNAEVETKSRRQLAKTPVKLNTESSTQAKRPAKKISPRTSNQKQDQNLSNKLSKSDYLNEGKKVVKTGTKMHDRSRTRTLSPSEVKVLPVKREDPVTKIDDQLMAVEVGDESENEEGSDYEDDFEDYESDFEEDDESESEEPEAQIESIERKRILVSSAEERERKLDSGSYHISAGPQKKEMEEIKIAVQNENRQQRKQSVVEDADEGFLEGGKRLATASAKSEFLDFDGATKRNKEQVNNDKATRRGEELLKMVTLDVITYSLMDIPAVPYDVFMASFGQSNTTQVHVQTNEDDCEEETQTDSIDVLDKWTQAPATFTSTIQNDGSRLLRLSKEERLGVGDPNVQDIEPFARINQTNLEKSLIKSAQKILISLEAQNNRILLNKDQKTSELSCCEGMMVLNSQSGKSEQSPVVMTATSNSHLVLAVEKTKFSETKIQIWSVLTPSAPIKILVCREEVTSICFGPGRGDLIFGGAKDGSINLWDLREANEHHSGEIGRSPTYSTSEVLKESGHLWPIVSVIILTREDNYDGFRPIQICSLDLCGHVITWSVVQQIESNSLIPNSDLGLAPWGRVRLVKGPSFMAGAVFGDSSNMKKFNTMAASGATGNEILIGMNNGKILHCSSDGSPLKPKLYEPSQNSRSTAITAISVFSSDPRFFLVGCDDGTIRLYDANQEKPLINLHWNLMDTSPTSCIKSLHWFPTRPCMFFSVDAKARIHVWDLSVSDIYPQTTVPASTQNPIMSAAALIPRSITQTGSIVLGRANGTVELHQIKTEKDKTKAIGAWKKESKMFQRYVKIL